MIDVQNEIDRTKAWVIQAQAEHEEYCQEMRGLHQTLIGEFDRYITLLDNLCAQYEKIIYQPRQMLSIVTKKVAL